MLLSVDLGIAQEHVTLYLCLAMMLSGRLQSGRVGGLLLAVIFALALVTPSDSAVAPTGEVSRGPVPAWIIPRPPDLNRTPPPDAVESGGHLLLLDLQIHRPLDQRFLHMATRIVTQSGIREYSDLTISYNPSFSSLTLHYLLLHREGRVHDRLPDLEIRTYRQEPHMDLGVYYGMATAVANLQDVRVGDVLEYAYTITGSLPLLADQVLVNAPQQFSFPVSSLYTRTVLDTTMKVFRHFHNGAEESRVDTTNGFREFSWEAHDLPARLIDANAPVWYDPKPVETITSFADWRAVAAWAILLYEIMDEDRAVLAARLPEVAAGETLDDRVLGAIRFVQDEVRYLARAEGLWSVQPRQPAHCLSQRFGDCKDKSLLLVGLLEALGLVAYPVLVSTVLGEHIVREAPSVHAFDHCIVGFIHEGELYHIDPTRSHQGGGFRKCHIHDFALGLPLRPDSGELQPIRRPEPWRLDIREVIEVQALGRGDAEYTIETRFFGQAADNQRALHSSVSRDRIDQSSREFYSAQYPGVEQIAPLEITDESREGKNLIIETERYRIRDIWQAAGDDTTHSHIECFPLHIGQCVLLSSSPPRTAPYDAGATVDVKHRTELHMPEPWPGSIPPLKIRGDAYLYNRRISSRDSLVVIDYHYRLWESTIPAEDTPAFLKAHERIRRDLSFFVYVGDFLGEDETSDTAVAVTVLALLCGAAICWFIGRRYDPEPRASVCKARRIAGWLVLPAIAIATRPLYYLVAVIGNSEGHARSTWALAEQGDLAVSSAVSFALLVSQLTANAVMLTFSVLVAWVFFKRRSSGPMLVVVHLLLAALAATVDEIAIRSLFNPDDEPRSYATLAHVYLHAMIWIPYFLSSKRVAETFVNRLRGGISCG